MRAGRLTAVAALAAACALVATASAAAGPVCVEVGCANVVDSDGDGRPDGLVVATGGEHHGASAYAFADGVFWQWDVAGDHDEPTYPVLAGTGWIATQDHDGEPALHGAHADATLYEVDSGSGGWTPVAGASVDAHDDDGDGVPDDATVAPLLP